MAPKISPHLLQSKLGRRFQPAGKIELARLATPQPKSATNAPPHSAVVAAEPLKVVDIPVAVLLPVVEHARVKGEIVDTLAESFTAVGQIQPISVSRDNSQDGRYKLHGGAHRVLAADKVGWTTIQALVFEREPEDLELIEIAENLHRKNLSVLETARQHKRWLDVVRQRGVQDAQPGGAQPHDKGYSKAARLCYETREGMRRSESIACIPDEVVSHIMRHELDNNQKVLLEIAKATTVEAQIEKIRDLVERKRIPARPRHAKSSTCAVEVTPQDPARTSLPPSSGEKFPSLPAELDRGDVDKTLDHLTQEWMSSRLRGLLLDASDAARMRFLNERLLPEIGALTHVSPARQMVPQGSGASHDA
jgi:ParB-like nuclease domain